MPDKPSTPRAICMIAKSENAITGAEVPSANAQHYSARPYNTTVGRSVEAVPQAQIAPVPAPAAPAVPANVPAPSPQAPAAPTQAATPPKS